MRLRLVIAAFVALIAFAACGGDDDGATPEAQGAGAGDAVEVTTLDNEFDPADITAPSGGAIALSNDGESPHNFSVRGEGIDVDVEPGESASVDLSGLDAGSYEVFCKLHEADGMTGTLEVQG